MCFYLIRIYRYIILLLAIIDVMNYLIVKGCACLDVHGVVDRVGRQGRSTGSLTGSLTGSVDRYVDRLVDRVVDRVG